MVRSKLMRLLLVVALILGVATAFASTASATPPTLPYTPGMYTPVVPGLPEPVVADFNGDGNADPAVVWDLGNGQLAWTINGIGQFAFCNSGDIPLPGAYYLTLLRTNGVTEPTTPYNTAAANVACYRPSNNTLYILSLNHGTLYTITFGNPGDQPLVGCFDRFQCDPSAERNQEYAELAVFRPSTGQTLILEGHNLVIESYSAGLGASSIRTVMDLSFVNMCSPRTPGTDSCDSTRVHPLQHINNSNMWYVQCQSGEFSQYQDCTSPFSFGTTTDQPLTYDYGWQDFPTNGYQVSHLSQAMVYRTSNHTFYVGNPNGGGVSGALTTQFSQQWGTTGDFPVPGDYTYGALASAGTPYTNFAVYRACAGQFLIRNSSGGTTTIAVGPVLGGC